jgi:hypothetical protein
MCVGVQGGAHLKKTTKWVSRDGIATVGTRTEKKREMISPVIIFRVCSIDREK